MSEAVRSAVAPTSSSATSSGGTRGLGNGRRVRPGRRQVADATRKDRDQTPADEGKGPAAVALRRTGGLKGGKARAAKLSAEERLEIARKTAAGWSRDSPHH